MPTVITNTQNGMGGVPLPVNRIRSRSFGDSRVCTAPICSTILSRYNSTDRCVQHPKVRMLKSKTELAAEELN